MLYSIKYQLFKDNDPERLAMIDSLKAERPWLGWIIGILDLPAFQGVKIFLSLIYAIFRIPAVCTEPGFINGMAWSANEKRIMEEFCEEIQLKKIRVQLFGIRFPSFLWLCESFRWRKTKKILSVAKRLSRKYTFPVAARAVETMILYLFFCWRLRSAEKQMVFLSTTQSHPHFSALTELAERGRAKLILLAHSPYVAGPRPIFLNLGLFWGPEGLRQFEKIGSRILQSDYYFPSSRFPSSESRSPKAGDSVLISLSKNPNWQGVEKLVERLGKYHPKFRILLRVHPNSLSNIPIRFLGMLTRKNNSLAKDLDDKIFMIAGNSTVHLEAFLHGVPSLLALDIDERPSESLDFLNNEKILLVDEILKKPEFENFLDAYGSEKIEEIRKKYFFLEKSTDLPEKINALRNG